MPGGPAYQITISASPEACVAESTLREAVTVALSRYGVPAAEIDVAIVDDREIERLNVTHLGHSGPTDVLTFDLREHQNTAEVDGQIVLSIDTARREAQARGHSVDAEAALYAVHGVLHLMGHDDATEADAGKMHQIEDDILQEIGLGPAFCSSRQ